MSQNEKEGEWDMQEATLISIIYMIHATIGYLKLLIFLILF